MLKLCTHHTDKKTGFVRATPHDRLAHFLINNEDVASHILSFIGIKWGEKDLRNTSNERMFELGQEVLRDYNDALDETFWGIYYEEEDGIYYEDEDSDEDSDDD